MIAIVNVNESWGIGKDGQLLCNLPEDMKFFRETTKRSIVVYGLNTLLSFPNQAPLKGRVNIVIADDYRKVPVKSIIGSSFLVIGDGEKIPSEIIDYIMSGIELGKDTVSIIVEDITMIPSILHIESLSKIDAYLCGGASIYKQLLCVCDKAYVTKNNCDKEADTFFTNLDSHPVWKLESESDEYTSVNGTKYRFCKYIHK